MRSVLFFLFLYVVLVWVVAAYRFSGDQMVEQGLLYTAIGIGALLVFLLLARLIPALGRIWRRLRSRPAPPAPTAAKALHEDEAVLQDMLAQAEAALAASTHGKVAFASLRVYLVIGPASAGKTSVLQHSGLELELLAGRGDARSAASPTRVANIWYAPDTLFVELAGPVYDSDLARWRQLLAILSGRRPEPRWKSLIKRPAQISALRGVIVVCDLPAFLNSPDQAQLDRQGRHLQERLIAVTEVFGVAAPFYLIFTKTDSVPYFDDYFHRLSGSIAREPLGCIVSRSAVRPDQNGHAASRKQSSPEEKDLMRLFNGLYRCLADRRVVHLAHEIQLQRKSGIYEFPREFKRVRPALVRFVGDIARPHPLRRGPYLRGFYFTGTRHVEQPQLGVSTTTGSFAPTQGSESTQLFRADATQMFRGEGTQILKSGDFLRSRSYPDVSSPPGALTTEWMFLPEFFTRVVLGDRAPVQMVASTRARRTGQAAAVIATAVSMLLLTVWLWSWTGNQRLTQDVARAAELQPVRMHNPPTLDDLRALEQMRQRVARLAAYRREGAPWLMRAGLFTGDDLFPEARDVYFRRLYRLLFADVHNQITSSLRKLPSPPAPDASDGPAYDRLKAHLMISTGSCNAEPIFLTNVLTSALEEARLVDDEERKKLATDQLAFYSEELQFGNPYRLPKDEDACHRAGAYLNAVKGVDRLYRAILSDVEKKLPRPAGLSQIAPEYRTVLAGSDEMKSAFTPAGLDLVLKSAREGGTAAASDSCVAAEIGAGQNSADRETERQHAIERLHLANYTEAWRQYLRRFSVLPYRSAGDAARKLEILSGHRSPVLALLALTANNTNFAAQQPPGTDKLKKTFTKFIPPVLKKADKNIEKKAQQALADARGSQPDPVSITQVFQPVHYVVPPASEKWVTEKTAPYTDALAELKVSMQAIARQSDPPDPAVHQAAMAAFEKAQDSVRQIARGFSPVGVEGLDRDVQRLLEEPVRGAKRFIIADIEKANAGKLNGDLQAFCGRIRGVLRKYPFSSRSAEDASMEEFAELLAPGTGEIWKFQASALAELVAYEGGQWKASPAAKAKPTPELIDFLNRAQMLSNAFFSGASKTPRLTYSLRPRFDGSAENLAIELEIDGKSVAFTKQSQLQRQFVWPAGAGVKAGAVGRVKVGPSFAYPFASRGGLWGVFRIFGDAEPRPAGEKTAQWKYARGSDGRREPIEPPVRLDIVEFPGGVDLFNPSVFEGLRCPVKAVQ
jgi:type VI secretion system protein ImpL